MSKELYNLLKEGESREIPWHVAAEHFLTLKIASGGLLPEDVEELQAEVEKIKVAIPSDPISKEELSKAVKSGYLSGVRSTVSGDMARSNAIHRKRGERAGKTMGSLAGAAGGALIGGKKNRMAGAALGTLLGYTAGKGIGEETDARRLRPKVKPAAIEKTSGLLRPDQPTAKELVSGKGPEARAARTALREKLRAECPIAQKEKTSDFGKEAENKDKKSRAVPLVMAGAGAGAVAGGAGRALKTAKGMRDISESASRVFPGVKKLTVLQSLGKGLKSGRTVKAALTGAGVGAMGGVAAELVRRKLKKKKDGLEKKAQEPVAPVQDESIPVEAPVVPPLDPMQLAAQETAAAGKQDPVEILLQAQQAANEAEFYRQRAEEAEEAAGQATEQAEMATQQAEQTAQQAEAQQQEGAMREQQMGQQAQVATQQAQMASQDSVQARDEALQAQNQNIQLRQAVTNFRQSLMDLVAQDPTQILGPPAAPQGPMPMGPGEQPPMGPEGAPGEPPPPEEGGMAPPEDGGPPPPPGAPAGPEMAPPPGPPMGPPPKPPIGGAPPGPPATPPATPPAIPPTA